MRISNKVGGKEGRVDKGQTAHICELCSNSVSYCRWQRAKKNRDKTTVAASFRMVGSICVALAALVFLAGMGTSWRVFAITCALPSAIGAALVFMLVPESSRFLALQGHSEEGLQVANQLVKQMNYNGPPLTLQEVLLQYLISEKICHPAYLGSISSLVLELVVGIREAWSDFSQSTAKLYSHQLQNTTWPLQIVWFSLSFGSYMAS